MEPSEIEIVKLVIRGIVWVTIITALCGAGKYYIRRHFDERAAERRANKNDVK